MECKLQVWKLAHQLTLDVYRVSKDFPSSEKYGLTNQVRRSASSVPTNIIEGQGRQYKKKVHTIFIYCKRFFGRSKLSIVFSKGFRVYF
jgi:four helix bundle protein